MERQVIAVCGKGGVGKTAFSALLSRVLIDSGVQPLLLIDADPAGGLTFAIGERSVNTLAGVRDRLIASARKGQSAQVANELDYLLLQALVERKTYSLLAMGHSAEKGCFCPANRFLKSAIDILISAFSAVLIDAEAGIEQINRDVTRRVSRIITVLDGSQKSVETLRLIRDMVADVPMSVVMNRGTGNKCGQDLPDGVEFLGVIPENKELRQFDREGRPLWTLAPANRALVAARKIVPRLGFLDENTERIGNLG
jgi:CO dehydrogenase maturation factor